MALAEYQAQVRDLVMGPGTNYAFLDDFNPFTLDVRADQAGNRAWGDGGYSGVEWREEIVVPMRLRVKDPANRTLGRWLELHQQLLAAFRPVGEAVQDVELRFALGGREYLMFGRPRVVEPDTKTIAGGYSVTRAAFVALDPTIYAGVETVFGPIGLPTFTGGLTIPGTMSAPLNSNTSFETDTSGWVAPNGTITRSTVQANTGVASGLLEPNGTSATVQLLVTSAAAPTVVVGTSYTWAAWVYSPASLPGVQLAISWRTAANVIVSEDVGTSATLTAGQWTQLSMTATAPVGAEIARPIVQITGTPAATVDLFVDDAELRTPSGGLSIPFSISGVAASGFTAVTNEGTKDTGLLLRLDGPVSEPSVTLERADGSFQRLAFDLELTASQWLDIDTKNRLVLLNGTSTRRGSVSGDWPILPGRTDLTVPPPVHTLRWNAPIFNNIAKLSGRFRSAWY